MIELWPKDGPAAERVNAILHEGRPCLVDVSATQQTLRIRVDPTTRGHRFAGPPWPVSAFVLEGTAVEEGP